MTDYSEEFPDARIFSRTETPFRDLSSFDKSRHSIPTAVNARALDFVERLTRAELDAELDHAFSNFRQSFQLKRRQMTVFGPAERRGVIETPWFRFEVGVDLSEDGQSVVWNREVNSISGFDRVTSEEFAECFDTGNWILEIQFKEAIDVEQVIDMIEDSEDPDVKVDYDKSCRWCAVTSSVIPATLRVTGSAFQIVPDRISTPAALISALVEFRGHVSFNSLTADNAG